MSVPRLLAQVLYLGTQIVGKAFVEAARQAARNARAGQVDAAASAAAGGSGAAGSAGSASEQLTRTHRMTLDEARQILNVKQVAGEEAREEVVKAYDRLFTINAPPAPKGQEGGGQGSFYLQSKIVRARERIEAEWEAAKKREGGGGGGGGGGQEGASGAGGQGAGGAGSEEGRAR